MDTDTVARATWTGPNGINDVFGQQPINFNRISVVSAVSMAERMFESTLVFHPVDFEEDSGLHTCDVTISSNTMFSLEDTLIEDVTNDGSTFIIVKGWYAFTQLIVNTILIWFFCNIMGSNS